MFESVDPSHTNVDQYHDITDALALGFWGMELEDCQPEDLPVGIGEDEVWSRCKIRRKNDYDPYSKNSVVVIHYSYVTTQNKVHEYREYLRIEWLDESDTNITFDVGTHEFGTHEPTDDDSSEYVEIPPESIEKVRTMSKMALIAIASE